MRSVPATAALKLRKPEGDEALLAANYPFVGALRCALGLRSNIVGVLSRYMSCGSTCRLQSGVLRICVGHLLTFEGSNGQLVGYDADYA